MHVSVGAHGREVGAQSPELSPGPGVTVGCKSLILVLRINLESLETLALQPIEIY